MTLRGATESKGVILQHGSSCKDWKLPVVLLVKEVKGKANHTRDEGEQLRSE